jgi:hypothetical protein
VEVFGFRFYAMRAEVHAHNRFLLARKKKQLIKGTAALLHVHKQSRDLFLPLCRSKHAIVAIFETLS